ncbi:MAG TPA: PaaI family thioesterase [Caulobacteraceae bacterium]
MSRPDEIPPPPPGFTLQAGRGAFTNHNGPYFRRTSARDGVEQAFFALERHCNGVGLIHGGMLSAFLDGLLAGAVAAETQATPITIHLSTDFLNMGRAGDWVFGHARLTRATREIAFADGEARVSDHVLARATGVFRLMRRRDP